MPNKDLLNKATQAIKSKDYQQAELYCLAIIEINPLSGDAYNILGMIHSDKQALLCSINNVIYLNNLAKALINIGKDVDGINTYEKNNSTLSHILSSLANITKTKNN